MDLEKFASEQANNLQDFPDEFIASVARSQQQLFNRINDLYSSLERNGDDIVMSETNLQIAEEIKKALPGIFNDSKYDDAVTNFVASFDDQKKLIDKFMHSQFGEMAKSDFADAVLEQTKRNAISLLSSSTVKTGFLQGLENQIDIAVSTGQSFRETVKQLRTYATGGDVPAGKPYGGLDKPGGKIVQYAKQISYDSIAIADRAYTNAIATELESEWYFFAGGILPTTRKFCSDRVGKYFHYKEIEAWAELTWQGKMENTTKATIFALLGGYNCQHTLIPVSIDQVPNDVVDRNIANGNFKPNEKKQSESQKAKNVEDQPAPKNDNPPIEKGKADVNDFSTWLNKDFNSKYKSLESATNYAKENFANAITAFNTYKPDAVNTFNQTMQTIFDNWGLNKLDTIELQKGRALASANGRTLHIKSGAFKSEAMMEKTLKEAAEMRRYQTENLQAHKKAYESLSENDALRKTLLKQKIDAMENELKFRSWGVSDRAANGTEMFMRVLTHESAHIIEDQVIGMMNGSRFLQPRFASVANTWKNQFNTLFYKYVSTDFKYTLGKYGTSNIHEFFAETFTMYHFERKELPSAIVEFYDNLFKYVNQKTM